MSIAPQPFAQPPYQADARVYEYLDLGADGAHAGPKVTTGQASEEPKDGSNR